MSTPLFSPDPVGLAIARKMQEQLRPALVILQGSRAAGDHRRDSDCDLMCSDHATLREMERKLWDLSEGKHTPPVVNVITVTEDEFRRTAPLAQKPSGTDSPGEISSTP